MFLHFGFADGSFPRAFCFTNLSNFFVVAAFNYVALLEALGVSPSVLAVGVAADNAICAIYFMVLFALSSKIPAEAVTSSNGMRLQH